MKQRHLCNILLFVLCLGVNTAHALPKDSIYNGTMVKLDILSPVLVPATNQWKKQHYEMAVNVRLAKRYYPTMELGYATPGLFFRAGADINPLKKHPDSPHALLVGVRIGTAVQTKGYADCWGEIVAGCQVEVAQVNRTAFYMGWMGRFKCLFTRATTDASGNPSPEYIPGFGTRDNIGWGLNYHIGWRF